jgi:glucosamine-6-phosphate deaminase
MVHELCAHCPGISSMLRRGTFVPVPGDGQPSSLHAHEARLQQLGGIALQLLGIGRNGHIAFNEPGSAFERGFHVAELAAETRADAQRRFQPAPVPTHGVTAGIHSILASRRIVLCAFGAGKTAAVRAMLQGEITVSCPASALRRHRNVLVLLDPAAAGGLGNAAASGS